MLKRHFYISILVPLICSACAIQPTLKSIAVSPQEVEPGEKGKLLVTFRGPSSKIESVQATVRENPEMSFQLNDEGKSGDQEAGDKIWSYEVTVPYDATPGLYHLDFTALDVDGEVIRPRESEEVPAISRSGTVEVTVK